MRSAGGHVLQSSAWARIREDQGWRAEFLRFGDPLPLALVLWRKLPAGQRLAYVPRGPIVADATQLPAALGALGAHARQRGAIFLKADPELDPTAAAGPLERAGFRRGQDIQPVLATLELDLGAEESKLFAALDKDTRWSVRQAKKRGVEVREANDEAGLRTLYDLYVETGRRARFITRTWEYYQHMWGALVAAGHARVRIARRSGQPLAGALVWRCGEREVYQSAATNDEGRSAYAAYLLLWQCIIEGRRSGSRRFDFGGIPADLTRKDDPMQGPYLFKKGFGGTPRRFAGAHDVVPRPLAYRAYRVAEPVYTAALRLTGRLRR